MKALNKMKKACFSTRPLDWTVGADWEFKWKSSIDGYVSAFLDLGIQRFPKFHIVEKHVAEFIEFTRQPLGNFSEQEFEALHSNFKPTWQRFKRSMANESYARQFLKAVVVYNSDHLK